MDVVKRTDSMTWGIAAPDPEKERRLAAALGLRPLIARLLVNRGMDEPESAARFLHPRLEELHDPSLLTDMDAAVARIRRALYAREKILILGDFDADGVTATALLYRLFRFLHADVGYHIPGRLEEGYGLHEESMDRFAEEGARLLVTVDCGITAGGPVAKARSLGMDVIVTDHHEPGEDLPTCTAVVDPKRAGESYPFRDLSGVGVAFKLAWALVRDLTATGNGTAAELKAFLWESLSLVALGTVADVVPLRGENRILVKHGLTALSRSRNPGERALLTLAGKERPDASDLAFRLAPRINAAGRLGDSRIAVELFAGDSYETALETAKKLDRMNRRRQDIEKRIFEQAVEQVHARSMEDDPVLLLESDAWHAGVIGIVASRLVEAYGRPAVLIAMDGPVGRGSARSVPAFHIQKAFLRCSKTLLTFGGHAQAAGLTLERDRLEAFRDALGQAAADILEGGDLAPQLDVEAEVPLEALNNSFLAELALFHPFGQGNPEPVLAAREGRIAGKPKTMGAGGKHLSFFFRQDRAALRAVAFGFGDRATELEGAQADLAFVPFLNRFRGRESVELRVKDIHIR
jgi:single-stranded-DNA-specific exonuclease